ncbi:hypothetical protein JOF53_000493 [Crossiella equi]|uniref:Uncharacterized protein n=1 Tax=Crossiella equi TaxID=130796 RepID=A0ABS5A5Q0_9PSEU|nr:hypothetical protein [Crossiella equi]MBP2471621.1 hypothetical protein [Crossiella equi]
MADGNYKVVTQKLREEAKIWRDKADKTRPIVQSVREAYLGPAAFFVGDLTTLVPGMANATLEAKAYEDFRALIEHLLNGAVVEFDQVDAALRNIADEYDRTESLNELDVDTFFRA